MQLQTVDPADDTAFAAWSAVVAASQEAAPDEPGDHAVDEALGRRTAGTWSDGRRAVGGPG